MNRFNLQRALYNTYPKCDQRGNCDNLGCNDDERFGGFWLPFLTGAIISAPAWYVIGANKSQQYQQPYYPGYYPQYYPYPPYQSYR